MYSYHSITITLFSVVIGSVAHGTCEGLAKASAVATASCVGIISSNRLKDFHGKPPALLEKQLVPKDQTYKRKGNSIVFTDENDDILTNEDGTEKSIYWELGPYPSQFCTQNLNNFTKQISQNKRCEGTPYYGTLFKELKKRANQKLSSNRKPPPEEVVDTLARP